MVSLIIDWAFFFLLLFFFETAYRVGHSVSLREQIDNFLLGTDNKRGS